MTPIPSLGERVNAVFISPLHFDNPNREAEKIKRSVIRLFIQVVCPLLFITIPASAMFTALAFNGIFSFEQCLLLFVVMHLHPIVHSILLLALTPAFRTKIVNLFGFAKCTNSSAPSNINPINFPPQQLVMVYTILNDTYPGVIEGHGEQLYFVPYEYKTLIGPEVWWKEVDHEHMYLVVREHWTLAVWISILYISGIHALQSSMKHRKPFDLKWPLILWNSAFAIFSLIGAIRMGEEYLYVVSNFPLLDSISYSPDIKQASAFWAFCFTVSKVVQLGDTLFVVLRKKPLLFLHWYHHAIALVYVWHGGKEGVAAGRTLALMNNCIHFLMYSYYALSAAGIRVPRVISKVISMLQIGEMFTAVAISCIVLYCKLQGRIMQHSYENLAFCFTIYFSFAILFSMKAFNVDKEKRKVE